MICVECGSPVESLYTIYSPDNIKATTCSNCENFADKYTEYDAVLVALDVALLRPQAIRHVVFNVLRTNSFLFIRIQVLILLFDVYIRWACMEKEATPDTTAWLARSSTMDQYMSFLMVCIADVLTVNAVVLLLARVSQNRCSTRAIFTTVLLSSVSKLLPLLTLIWDYDTANVSQLSLYVVGIITTEFLHVCLQGSYWHSLAITVAALGARWYVCENMLWPSILRG